MKQEWSREGDDPRCGNCRHWARTDQELLGASDDPAGQCRRRAPVRSVSEVELAGRIASAVHDVGLRIMDAAGKVMTVAGYDAKGKRTVRDPIPEHEGVPVKLSAVSTARAGSSCLARRVKVTSGRLSRRVPRTSSRRSTLTGALEVGDRFVVKPGVVKDRSGNLSAGTSATVIKAQASPRIQQVLMSELKHCAHNSWTFPLANPFGGAVASGGAQGERQGHGRDLLAALRASSAFDHRFSAGITPCAAPMSIALTPTKASCKIPAESANAGRTQFANEVNFNAYINTVANAELLEDLLGAPVDMVTDEALRSELRPYVAAEAVDV